MDAVTEILLDRSRDADKVAGMVLVSLIAHAVLIGAFTFLPRHEDMPKDDAHVMTISLSGPPGPIQGQNPIAAKAIQVAVPETVKPKDDAPPALTKPEMVEAVKTARVEPKAVAKPDVKKPEPQLHGRTPTQGTEVNHSTARIDTQGSAFGSGLATGGGGGGAARTDVGDFCCPEYLQTMQRLIRANWQEKQGQVATNTVKFVIRRDGTITDIVVEKGANPYLDIASQRALMQTRRLPPLPAAFTLDHLTVHLDFEYKQ
jgi:outer membrane biosynthesis protein TonB